MRTKTLRKMSPAAREVGKLSNAAASVARRLRNLSRRLDEENAANRAALAKTIKEMKDRRI